jgi:hypothetical protein
MLINSLLAHANDAWWEEFIFELERLNVRKAVVVRPYISPVPLAPPIDPPLLSASCPPTQLKISHPASSISKPTWSA